MGEELTTQQSFEEKLSERIRADIGELMPDEALRRDAEFRLQENIKTGLETFLNQPR